MAGIVVSLADLSRAAQAMGGPLAPPIKGGGGLDAATVREVLEIGKADIKRRFMSSTAPDGTRWKPLRYGRPGGGDRPLQDTGALVASIQGRAEPGRAVWFTNRVGAGLHNAGGTVVPRKGKFLAIALSAQAKRAGSPRRMTGTPQMPLFARPLNGRLVGHFLLVKKVVVPKREFMGLSPRAVGAIAEAVAAGVARQWQNATPR